MNNLSDFLQTIKVDLIRYIDHRLRLFKIDGVEKISITASLLGYGFMITLIVANILLFGFLALGFLLGEVLGSTAAGFGIVCLVSLFILLIVVLLGKRIKNYLLNKVVAAIYKMDDEDE